MYLWWKINGVSRKSIQKLVQSILFKSGQTDWNHEPYLRIWIILSISLRWMQTIQIILRDREKRVVCSQPLILKNSMTSNDGLYLTANIYERWCMCVCVYFFFFFKFRFLKMTWNSRKCKFRIETHNQIIIFFGVIKLYIFIYYDVRIT